MAAGVQHIGGQDQSRKSSRRLQIIVVFVAFISVVVFRVMHDRKLASDSIRYADTHEATEQMTAILNKVPESEKLATSFRYLNSESPGMRYAAVDSLEFERGDRNRIMSALEHAYLDSATEVRTRVLDLMPKFDPQRGYQLELEALLDEDSWVKDHAMFLLSANARQKKSYVDKRSVPILIHTISDADSNLAPIAIPMLMKYTGITGKGWRYSVLDPEVIKLKARMKWLNWWATNRSKWPAKEFETLAPVAPTRADPAPGFLVKDIDRKRIGLDDMRGKVVLLNFWGTWCPPCRQETPALVDVDRVYHDKGLEIVGIAVKEKGVDSLRDWCRLHGIKYRQVLDADAIAHVYGDCYEVPVSVLIDKHGMIRRRWEGERDYPTFSAAVDRLIKE